MRIFLGVLMTGWLSLSPLSVHAVNSAAYLGDIGTAAYGNSDGPGSIESMIGLFISVLLGLLGVIMLVSILYAGFLWMTAGGNTDQVGKAKDWMRNSIIGLLIILTAYISTSFIMGLL